VWRIVWNEGVAQLKNSYANCGLLEASAPYRCHAVEGYVCSGGMPLECTCWTGAINYRWWLLQNGTTGWYLANPEGTTATLLQNALSLFDLHQWWMTMSRGHVFFMWWTTMSTWTSMSPNVSLQKAQHSCGCQFPSTISNSLVVEVWVCTLTDKVDMLECNLLVGKVGSGPRGS